MPDFKFKTLQFLSKSFTSHILCYHSCFEEVPPDLRYHLHNVHPEVIYDQLKWYKKNYQIVSLTDWLEAKNKNGLVAVTFDDAYKSVFESGLDILEALDIPATIFVIGCTLQGEVFWRDKVRHILSNNLIKEFINFLSDNGFSYPFNEETFYTESKKDAFTKAISNSTLDLEMDKFLEINLQQNLVNYCANNPEQLINHPLLSYGNHSFKHYILSSLDDDEQRTDLKKNHSLLKNIAGNAYSEILSVPFGGNKSINDTTVQACKELGISAILLNNNVINRKKSMVLKNGVIVAERFMVPDSLDGLIQKIKNMSYQQFKSYKFF